jgi:hypothetical protein
MATSALRQQPLRVLPATRRHRQRSGFAPMTVRLFKRLSGKQGYDYVAGLSLPLFPSYVVRTRRTSGASCRCDSRYHPSGLPIARTRSSHCKPPPRFGLGVGLCRVISAITGLVRVKGPIAGMAATLWVLIHPDLRRVARIRHAFTLPSYDPPHLLCRHAVAEFLRVVLARRALRRLGVRIHEVSEGLGRCWG